MILDVGDAASVLLVAYGGGIVHQETFSCGVGQISAALMQEFGVDFDKACEILAAADVSGGFVKKDVMWTDRDGNSYPVQRINDVIKCSLDELCEYTDDFSAAITGIKKLRGIPPIPYISRERAWAKYAGFPNTFREG